MKCLSVQQPWAWALIHGPKRIENRTWPTSYRGPLAIHAGKSQTRLNDFGTIYFDATGFAEPTPDKLAFGAVIGTVTLLDCVRREQLPVHLQNDPFAEGPWCWIVSDPVAFSLPIPCRGFQGLFEWDDVKKCE